jgi:hypothetical protein
LSGGAASASEGWFLGLSGVSSDGSVATDKVRYRQFFRLPCVGSVASEIGAKLTWGATKARQTAQALASATGTFGFRFGRPGHEPVFGQRHFDAAFEK